MRPARWPVTLAVALCLLVGIAQPRSAAAAEATPAPTLDAKAWLLLDAGSGETLARRGADRELAIASTTKMMTAWVAMRTLSPSTVVRAAPYNAEPAESLMGLEAGQLISVRDLLYGLILLSGNDAAQTLAIASAGSVPAFVDRMNRQAEKLGLSQTHYANPIGLDDPGNYSSARDLTTLGRRLMEKPAFRRIATARSAVLGSLRPPRRIETRNTLLLELPWANGIKTGHTTKAGYVLVGSGRLDRTELIAAVLGTDSIPARDAETRELLEYGLSLYATSRPLRKGRSVSRAEVKYGGGTLGLRAARNVRIGRREDQRLKVRVMAPEVVEGPITRGQRMGRAVVLLDGRRMASVPLLAGRTVPKASIFDRLFHSAWTFSALALLSLFVILIAAALLRRRRRHHPNKSTDEDGMTNSTGTSRVRSEAGRRGGKP